MTPRALAFLATAVVGFSIPLTLQAVPRITRLTPPSGLFSYDDPAPPIIARFLPGQRFDVQATVRPDVGATITSVEFFIDGNALPGPVALAPATSDWVREGTITATLRAISRTTPGTRTLTVRAVQNDGAIATATGNFEVVSLGLESGTKARNLIIMIGDGMGVAHRTAARVMLHGVTQGKTFAPLAMDTLTSTALVKTASLNSLLTDSSPSASAYTTGNKSDNGHVGVFPDDTKSRFDNPRVELIAEYLARTKGKWLGVVTTADVTDATPSAFAGHSQDRVAGTGIADAYFDEAIPNAQLHVLLGGGRGNFLPETTLGSSRSADFDVEHPAELTAGWNIMPGKIDPARDLLADFRHAGFAYAATRAQLAAIPGDSTRLLGLFAFSHMNSAMDRIAKRRGRPSIVDDYGLPDQPLLDEMTEAALNVLRKNPAGFVLLVEGALIDKYSHAMDSERWIHEVIEFDRAVAKAKAFAQAVPDTLVIVTADHESGGANVIGASRVTRADLAARAASGGGTARLRDDVVASTISTGFPNYTIQADGYPDSTDVDHRLLIGYAANADRYEDWLTNSKQIGGPANSPASPLQRDTAGGFLITGQVPGDLAGHTGADVPLSAYGLGASSFTGVLDNTDVFFRLMQAAISGTATVGIAPTSAQLIPNQRAGSNRLINLSSRGHVGSGADSVINGFTLSGSSSHRLLVRGVGPSLTGFGVDSPLRDPVLNLRSSAGAIIASNNDWESNSNLAALQDAAAAVGAFQLASGSRDSALLVELPPGSYTVQLAGGDGGTGVGLLEIYELP